MSDQPLSTREKMEQAKQLIQQKRYDEARTILRTVDHDKAYEWLDKINQLDPQKKSKRSPIIIIGLVVIVASIAVIAGVLYILKDRIGTTASVLPTAASKLEDAIAPLSAKPTNTPLSPVTDVPTAGKWQTSESKSSIDDTETVVVTLDSEDQVSDGIVLERPSIIVRCRSKELDAYINTGTHIEETYTDSKEAQLRLRFDKNDPSRETWNTSTDGQAVFADYPGMFVSYMLHAKTMVFEFTPLLREVPQEATFDLTGLSEAIKPVFQACGITRIAD